VHWQGSTPQAPQEWLEKKPYETILPVVKMVTDNDLKKMEQERHLQSIKMQSFVFDRSKQPEKAGIITPQANCQQKAGEYISRMTEIKNKEEQEK